MGRYQRQDVTAPNGKQYKAHVEGNVAFVYALGHRVYGTFGTPVYDTGTAKYVTPFKPEGKWAFILADTAAKNAETADDAVNA